MYLTSLVWFVFVQEITWVHRNRSENCVVITLWFVLATLLGITSRTYLCLLQLFLSFAISEVCSLIEIKEQHKEDDRVYDQHTCHQFRVSTVKNEGLG